MAETPRNLVGPSIRRLREQRGLTQRGLAAKCALAGWSVEQNTLARIENRQRAVTDVELLFLCRVLNVSVETVLPSRRSKFFVESPDTAKSGAQKLMAR